MSKKKIFITILLLMWLYPLISMYLIDRIIDNGPRLEELQGRLTRFQISIWITWLVMVIVAIAYKWNSRLNLFFFYTYGFVVVASSAFAYYYQRTVNLFDLPSVYNDSYTLGVFIALQTILVAGLLTAFLQVAVWWFTRKWHRN